MLYPRILQSGRHCVARLSAALIIAVVSSVSSASVSFAQSEQSGFDAQFLDRLNEEANLIYEGTVIGTGSGATSAEGGAVLTRVDSALRTPPGLAPIEGKNVNLMTSDDDPLEPRDRFVFFARTSLVGQEITAQEIARLAADTVQELRGAIAQSEERMNNVELAERLRTVDVVVVGQISEVDSERPPPAFPVSEHDPQWQRARLEVEQVLSGDLQDRTLSLVFPGTQDVAWVDAPRPRPEQQAVWLLTAAPELDGFTALDPLDAQPASQADRIRRLLEIPQ